MNAPSKVPAADIAEDEDAKLEREVRQAVEDLRWLMGHKPGRRFVRRLLERTGVYRTSFHTSGSVMSFNEGQRNVGLGLVAEIQEHAPDQFLLMLKEQTSE